MIVKFIKATKVHGAVGLQAKCFLLHIFAFFLTAIFLECLRLHSVLLKLVSSLEIRAKLPCMERNVTAMHVLELLTLISPEFSDSLEAHEKEGAESSRW